MVIDSWLPIAHPLPGGTSAGRAIFEGVGWQILETGENGRALVVESELAQRWFESRLLDRGSLTELSFGPLTLFALSCGPHQTLAPVPVCRSPRTKDEALAFALALRATRDIDPDAPLQDSIYVERESRLLPTYSISPRTDDDIVFGFWLTGGAHVSVRSFRRLQQTLTWLGADHLREVVEAGGFPIDAPATGKGARTDVDGRTMGVRGETAAIGAERMFALPGRPELEAFVNEHIIEVIEHADRYQPLGINFPSAIVLHGPPGCGKTFAIQRLVEYLGWPTFTIDASSVASPYIHETSKKVAGVFDAAMQQAPAVLIIDEMEAFLAGRDVGGGQHHVEEVAEFLRRIPEATVNEVLVVGMTNRIDMIDDAILRRGRFDHIVEVGYASEQEVLSLLQALLSTLPTDGEIDTAALAKQLAGRPLSDVAFVVREGARLAARSGMDRLSHESLRSAISSSAERQHGEASKVTSIGFI